MYRDTELKEKLDRLYFKTINFVKVTYDKMPTRHNKNKKMLLKKNVEYKNQYKGKRCFIVANGPSINEEDIDVLKGEYILTVNQMVRKEEFVQLNPSYNFWCDPAYFDESMPEESKKEFSDIFKKTCYCNENIVNFVPLAAYDFLSKRGLITDRVRFFDSSLYFYDDYNKTLDLTKRMPAFQNIVQYAIGCAIYMGFEEIYLLGCDSTGIITKINSVLSQDINNCYTYELNHEAQKYVNSLLDYFSVEEQFWGWTRIFHLYDQLYKYCCKRGIRLINCSKSTIIQSIPRKLLHEVKNEEGV